MRIGPQSYPGCAGSRFQFLKDHIPRRILPIPPAPALLDAFLIGIYTGIFPVTRDSVGLPNYMFHTEQL